MMTYDQFLWRWIRVNNICVLFFAGVPETKLAYRKYLRTRKIPLTTDTIANRRRRQILNMPGIRRPKCKS